MMVPTGKRLMSVTMFDNSKEFTQLGNLAKENRVAEYYNPDISTQVKANFMQTLEDSFPPTTN